MQLILGRRYLKFLAPAARQIAKKGLKCYLSGRRTNSQGVFFLVNAGEMFEDAVINFRIVILYL